MKLVRHSSYLYFDFNALICINLHDMIVNIEPIEHRCISID